MAGPEFEAGPVEVRRIEPLAAIALRHPPGASEALAGALRAAGVTGIPSPGEVLSVGQGTSALWRSPSEVVLLATERAAADAALAALAADALAGAVDQSDGTLDIEMQCPWVDEFLQRLVDSHSLPMTLGSAVRARLADIAVTLVRHDHDRIWLLAGRSHEHYLASWLAYAGAALARTRS